MSRMQTPLEIKICGLTQTPDVLEALRLGATALGFILVPGARHAQTDWVKQMSLECAQTSPRVSRVGVFRNPTIAELDRFNESKALTAIQLHGTEDFDFARAVKSKYPELMLIKALEVEANLNAKAVECYSKIADVILFDAPRKTPSSPTASVHGPAKRQLDVDRLEGILREVGGLPRFWIAGGLEVKNVAAMIVHFNPHGIDVSSGVEGETPGIKDHQKILEFVLAAQGAKDATR